jgi:Spy/CpxP family protein refolding chaperone
MANTLDEMQLTDSKRAQVRRILDEYRQVVANWNREHAEQRKALMQQLREARRDGDAEAAEAARKQLEELAAEFKQLWQNAKTQLADLLTPEQLSRLEEALKRHRNRARLFFGALGRLDLTDAQRQQAREIFEAARAAAEKTDDPRGKRRILAAAWRKVREEVLTAEQREQLDKMRRRFVLVRGLERLNLTEDQKAEIEVIAEETRQAMAEAESPEARREAVQAGRRKIIEEVLTERQRQQLREWARRRPVPAGRPRGAGEQD